MQYLIYPFFLLIYFELFGRWVMMKLKKEPFPFSFVIGFLAVMAGLYLLMWPITAFNRSFTLLCVVCTILFLVSLFLIIKDFKKLSFRFDYKLWIVLGVLLLFEIGVSYTKTLGDPHGFDVLYYTNMISFNIGNDAMNTLHPHFGTYPNTDVQWITYVFQSFYYFIPYVIATFRWALGFVGISFETLPAFTWGFQIIAHAIFIAASLLVIKEINSRNKWLNLAFVVLLVLFMGNFYYNNAFGFIGNNYRMSIHAIATLFLFRYFKGKDKKDLYLFYLSMLGMCAVSSTGTFSFVFALFGLFFVLYKEEKNLLKQYAVVLFVPLINILVTKFGLIWWVFVAAIGLCVLVYFLNDWILKIYQNKYLRYGTVVLASLVFIILSFLITKNPFDFHIFFNNYSEFQDMSWDYFWFYDLRHWIFNLMVLIPLLYYLIKERKQPFAMVSWILILVFFNPFGCTFMNKINWVYYRSYDIIINQFTIVYFLYYLYENIKKPLIQKGFTFLILGLSLTLAVIQIPRYYHESFVPSEDYNPIYKINNSELEVIRNVRALIDEKGIEHPAIITSTFWMPSFIEDSTYLIGKERRYNYDQFDDNSYGLYLIFFPTDGWDNFRPTDKPDYDHVVDLLKESDYDILVVDYGLYGTVNGEFISLADAVEMDGTYHRSTYSTAKYAVFYLGE